MSNIEIQSILESSEQPKSAIEYVSAMHTTNTGIWFPHLFNEESLEYIRSKNPDILAVDGYAADININPQNFLEGVGLDKLKIFEADPAYYSSLLVPLDSMLQIIDKDFQELGKSNSYFLGKDLAVMGYVGAAALLMGDAVNNKISRRTFLKAVPTTTLAYILNAAGNSNYASISRSEYMRNLLQSTNYYLGPVLEKSSWWINGRTAIITEKLQNCSTKNKYKRPMELMGNEHDYRAKKIIENPEYRIECIENYYKGIFIGIDAYIKESKVSLPEDHKQIMIGSVSNYTVSDWDNGIYTRSNSIETDNNVRDIGYKVLNSH